MQLCKWKNLILILALDANKVIFSQKHGLNTFLEFLWDFFPRYNIPKNVTLSKS